MDFTSNSAGDDIPPLDQQSNSAILEGTISGPSTAIEDEAVQSDTASFKEKAKANGKYPLSDLPTILDSFAVVSTEAEFIEFTRGKISTLGLELMDETTLKNAFKLSEAVVQVVTKDRLKKTYSGTGTVFNLDEEVVIFTNRHVVIPKAGESWVSIIVKVNGTSTVDVTTWETCYHEKLDVAKIIVPKIHRTAFTNKFEFHRPHSYEMDYLPDYLKLFPTTEDAKDTGYLFIAVGHPLGLKKRVSAWAACKRVSVVDGVYTHRAPTFGGNSGSIVFAIPVGKGVHGIEQAKYISNLMGLNLKCIAGIHIAKPQTCIAMDL